ncbi:MAG: hypothetical protein WC948_03515 [Thermovirgaceae bacterium]|jgi:hypothetical protein
MKKGLFALVVLLISFLALPVAAADYDAVIKKWTKEATFKSDYQSELTVTVTYYAEELIEALIQSEAEKNLWTADELENHKYQLLKSLNLEENIPIHIEFFNRGPAMHMAPFDQQLVLWMGKKNYKPVEYDPRFNFRLEGKRDGMVFFPRYDEKGKSLLEKVNTIRLVIKGEISAQTIGKSIEFMWDTVGDSGGGFTQSHAMERLEADRLIRRLQKLNAEKAELEEGLRTKEQEIGEIEARLAEIQSKN